MRSPYEDSAGLAADNNNDLAHKYQYNNNNYYKSYSNGGNGAAIPYHARENSLPFSYGQISKTSTPLRKTPTPTKADSFLDADFYAAAPAAAAAGATDAHTIKPQPRLTSPLLVRKTLGSRSPTRSTAASTNTIANTYHYNHKVTPTPTPTPKRDNFEQLLRERRDKVFSEYRERERVPPTPPQRQHYLSSNGVPSKYNYDFEFNLNLSDGLEAGVGALELPQRYETRNIDVPDGTARARARAHSQTTSTYVERNYRTINSERPPLEVTYKRQQATPTPIPIPTQSSAAFGNGMGAGAHYGQSKVQTLTRSRRDLSPIYATTAKQQLQLQRGNVPNTNGHAVQPDYLTPSPSLGRPETPAFPVTPRTPFGTQLSQPESIYQTAPRRPASHGQEPQEVAAHLVKFARNSAKFWYKANLSREDAIALLLNAPPGTFVVRDSTTYKNAYGLVLRVAQPPPGSSGEQPQDLVRHFLIEPTQRGVRLKGCTNEPVFTSLSALVYEHSINQLALPCLLRIPGEDVVPTQLAATAAQQQLLMHGAATNVLWLYSCDTESLTGNEAIRKAVRQLYAQRPLPEPTEVHFKVTQQGITLTDNTRKKFFRKHYTADVISHCAIDPDNRLWSEEKTIFAFIARRSHSSKDNQCHVFCDLSRSQPAVAIVSFANRTLPTEQQRNYVL